MQQAASARADLGMLQSPGFHLWTTSAQKSENTVDRLQRILIKFKYLTALVKKHLDLIIFLSTFTNKR